MLQDFWVTEAQILEIIFLTSLPSSRFTTDCQSVMLYNLLPRPFLSEMMKDPLSVCKVKHSPATLNMVLTPLFIVTYSIVIATEDRCLLPSP